MREEFACTCEKIDKDDAEEKKKKKKNGGIVPTLFLHWWHAIAHIQG
jgi:hypothetical protein